MIGAVFGDGWIALALLDVPAVWLGLNYRWWRHRRLGR